MKEIKTLAIIWDQHLWGGVDSYLAYLLNSKAFEKIDVTIYTNIDNQGLPRLEKLLEKKVEFVKYSNIINLKIQNKILRKVLFFFKPLLFLISFIRFKFLFFKKNYDVFLAQCGGYGSVREEMAALLSLNKNEIKIISMVIHHACTYAPPFLNLFLRLINYFLTLKLSSVICISKATRDSVFHKSNLFDNQLLQNLVIYNGVKKKDDNTNNKKQSDEIIKVGMISRIEKYKGHEDLISAVNILPKTYFEKFKFYLIGGGEKKEIARLRNLIDKNDLKNHIFIKGYVDKKIDAIIKDFDLVLSLTRTFEGFGLSLAESIALEVPVITTEVGAIKEYLTKDQCEIIDPSSPNQIKDALIRFYDDKEKWKLRAIKAKIYLEENFSSEIMAANYLNHFNAEIRNEL